MKGTEQFVLLLLLMMLSIRSAVRLQWTSHQVFRNTGVRDRGDDVVVDIDIVIVVVDQWRPTVRSSHGH